MKAIFAALLLAPSFSFAAATYKCDLTLGTNDDVSKPLAGIAVTTKDAFQPADGVAVPQTAFTIDIQIYETGGLQAVNVILVDTKSKEATTVAYVSDKLGSQFTVGGAKKRGEGFSVTCRQ